MLIFQQAKGSVLAASMSVTDECIVRPFVN